MTKIRLSSDERRQAILDAAIPLFVEQGFRGVTTRLLAQKAGVSEALLYQHFPSKEALYAEVQDVLCAEPAPLGEDLEGNRPSTETLVWVLFMATRAMIDPPASMKTNPLFPRLMLQSLLDDGAFARLHTERRLSGIADLVTKSLLVARAEGDMESGSMFEPPEQLNFWFAHHVMAMVHLMNLSDEPVLSYPEDKQKTVDYVMTFVLRGIGLTQAAIHRYYDRDHLRQRFENFIGSV